MPGTPLQVIYSWFVLFITVMYTDCNGPRSAAGSKPTFSKFT